MGRPESVLITGANGFVGRRLVNLLLEKGYNVRCALRQNPIDDSTALPEDEVEICIVDLVEPGDFTEALNGVDVVIHLAARVHERHDHGELALAACRNINVFATRALAEQAATSGVRRFIYISSIKVNGEYTERGIAFSESDTPQPTGAYAVSKWEAEQVLHKVAAQSDMEAVILRPPLVYGPGVKANFLRLLKLVSKGWPMPLGGINNRRSFIALDNLVDAIAFCVRHTAASGETFLVSDGEDLSTPELIREIAQSMGKKDKLFPIPAPMAKILLTVGQKYTLYERLWGSLVVNSTKIRRKLGWQPPVTVNDALKNTVQWYINEYH